MHSRSVRVSKLSGRHSTRRKSACRSGPIKSDLNVDVEIVSNAAGRNPITRGEEGSRASSLTAENTLRLTSLSEKVLPRSRVVGRLGKFCLGAMKKKAGSLSRDFVAAFEQRLEQPASD